MPVLHLGVVDLPYVDKGETTGDVAEILEAKYHVMEMFAEVIGEDVIAGALEHSVETAIESVMLGSNSAGLNLTAEGEQEIEAAFRIFLDQQEMDGRVAGVPTAAALAGVNHRLARPYAKGNPQRPSFEDTGLYQSSFKAWVEE